MGYHSPSEKNVENKKKKTHKYGKNKLGFKCLSGLVMKMKMCTA